MKCSKEPTSKPTIRGQSNKILIIDTDVAVFGQDIDNTGCTQRTVLL